MDEWLLFIFLGSLLILCVCFANTFRKHRPFVILDLNKLLVYRAFKPTLQREFPQITTDMLKDATLLGKHYTWLRPGAKEFVQELLKFYQVAIWSSAMSDNVSLLVQHVFGCDRHLLAFEWSQTECEAISPNPDPQETKPLFKKPLHTVLKAFPGRWSLDKMLILDDSPAKMVDNPQYAVMIVKEWTPYTNEGQTLDDILKQVKLRLK